MTYMMHHRTEDPTGGVRIIMDHPKCGISWHFMAIDGLDLCTLFASEAPAMAGQIAVKAKPKTQKVEWKALPRATGHISGAHLDAVSCGQHL